IRMGRDVAQEPERPRFVSTLARPARHGQSLFRPRPGFFWPPGKPVGLAELREKEGIRHTRAEGSEGLAGLHRLEQQGEALSDTPPLREDVPDGCRHHHGPNRKARLVGLYGPALEAESPFEQADGLVEFAPEPVEVPELPDGRGHVSWITELFSDSVGFLGV